MSIAEKLQLIAENEQKVFDAGKKAEYDAFWDAYQNYGNRRNYISAFSYNGWTDATFKPKYDISPQHAGQMFYCSPIKDVATAMNGRLLDFSNCISYGNLCQSSMMEHFPSLNVAVSTATNATMVFHNCQRLHTIDLLTVAEHNTFANWFSSCPVLENITFKGLIKNNIDFKECPLTLESAINVIQHLYDYRTTTGAFPEAEGAFDFTVQFSESTWALLDADPATSTYYGTWREELTAMGWNY